VVATCPRDGHVRRQLRARDRQAVRRERGVHGALRAAERVRRLRQREREEGARARVIRKNGKAAECGAQRKLARRRRRQQRRAQRRLCAEQRLSASARAAETTLRDGTCNKQRTASIVASRSGGSSQLPRTGDSDTWSPATREPEPACSVGALTDSYGARARTRSASAPCQNEGT
jgi:hypothetical protein